MAYAENIALLTSSKLVHKLHISANKFQTRAKLVLRTKDAQDIPLRIQKIIILKYNPKPRTSLSK